MSPRSRSANDLTAMLRAIARTAAQLCEARDALIYLLEGDQHRLVAKHGTVAQPQRLGDTHPVRRDTPLGRAVLDRRAVHVPDIVRARRRFGGLTVLQLRVRGVRTVLAMPLMDGDVAVGGIVIRRTRVQPFSRKQISLLKTFAEQAAIAIDNARLSEALDSRNRDLTAALEQQTATAEILRTISRSYTDVQPVFQAIVDSAARLLGGHSAVLSRIVDDRIDLAAYTHTDGVGDALLESFFPMPLHSSGSDIRPIRDRVIGQRIPYNVADVETDPRVGERGRASARARGYRSQLVVPMLRDGDPIGTLAVTRREPGAFTGEETALLRTFADQAVIAIENVRLFRELQTKNRELTTALDQQIATSEILRAISRSLTDVQPVFNTIVQSGLRLLGGYSASMMLLRDNDCLDLVAYTSTSDEADASLVHAFPLPLHRIPPGERAVHERGVHAVEDIESAPNVTDVMRETSRTRGWRSNLFVPMIRDDVAVGLISITRREPGPFAADQIALLEIFAAQAVIAIENVRLFRELEARNRDLTATGEILEVISRSPTDAQPVFDTIADNAVRLFRPWSVAVYRFDGEFMHVAAVRGGLPGSEQYLREQGGRRPTRDVMAGRCIIDRSVIHVPDFETDPNVPMAAREIARVRGFRATINVPMLRGGEPIGVVSVSRAETGPFSQAEIDLLQTFADQAVIAIENVRLFNELKTRTEELTRSVEQLTALGEVGRAVSSTLDLETVLTTIASRAAQLTATDACTVYEYDEGREEFHLRATHNVDERILELTRVRPIRKGEGATGRVAETHAPVEIEDVARDGAYHGPLRQALLEGGVRSVLAVPLLREARLIGVFIVSRKTTGKFADEVVAVLQTFATQSAIAIYNARLYRELEAKGRELETASRHKSQFLANMSHELRTPMNAIIGYTELIADGIYGAVPEPMRDVLTRVDASGRHLLGLINDVLDLSKIEAGQLTLTLAEYSMKEVVESVLAATEPLAAERRLKLVVELPPDLPTGRGDQQRLAQVLLNLVGNAIKFTDEGHVAVRVGTAAGMFVISVSDTGPGIRLADQERIFEEFQQADTSHTRPKGGTGLGLAIARRIVTMHGGRIWVESTPGAGATFRITMPVRVEEQVAVDGVRS